MENIFFNLIQGLVALGLLNVWLLRFDKSTDYRGGEARSLKEEFATYGLPEWFFYLIGFLKITSAILLLAGFFFTSLVLPAGALVILLMLGAVSMHIKVKDPIKKSVPAVSMLVMSCLICLGSV